MLTATTKKQKIIKIFFNSTKLRKKVPKKIRKDLKKLNDRIKYD